jgi:cytochrome c5
MWARNLALLGMQLLAGATVFAASPPSLPEGPGRKTLESACTACHTLDVVTSKKWSRGKWQDVVPKMDAGLNQEQTADVVGYLARNFGPPNQGKDRGRELVVEICSFCHGLERLQGQAFTRDEWNNVIKGMVDEGAPVTSEEFSLILDYLAKNFGPAEEQR